MRSFFGLFNFLLLVKKLSRAKKFLQKKLGLDFAHLIGDHLGIGLSKFTLPGGSVVVGAAVAGRVAVDDAEAAAAAAVET